MRSQTWPLSTRYSAPRKAVAGKRWAEAEKPLLIGKTSTEPRIYLEKMPRGPSGKDAADGPHSQSYDRPPVQLVSRFMAPRCNGCANHWVSTAIGFPRRVSRLHDGRDICPRTNADIPQRGLVQTREHLIAAALARLRCTDLYQRAAADLTLLADPRSNRTSARAR